MNDGFAKAHDQYLTPPEDKRKFKLCDWCDGTGIDSDSSIEDPEPCDECKGEGEYEVQPNDVEWDD